jgi:hypothetical protein
VQSTVAVLGLATVGQVPPALVQDAPALALR